jgi:hypothetical protein
MTTRHSSHDEAEHKSSRQTSAKGDEPTIVWNGEAAEIQWHGVTMKKGHPVSLASFDSASALDEAKRQPDLFAVHEPPAAPEPSED